MDRFVIKNERLDLKDVLDFFVLTTNDFPDFKEYLKSASNLNCSKELEHYAS